MRSVTRSVLLLGLALLAIGAAQPVSAESPTVVVHLGHYSDDLHSASMALALANSLREAGGRVVLFLDREGVRLADRRAPQSLRWGQGPPIEKSFDAFVAGGGQVLLCPHCAEAAGIDAAALRPGARIGKDAEIAELLLKAGQVIDY